MQDHCQVAVFLIKVCELLNFLYIIS